MTANLSIHHLFDAFNSGSYGNEEPTAMFINQEDWNSIRERYRSEDRYWRIPDVPVTHLIFNGKPLIGSKLVPKGQVMVVNTNHPFEWKFNFIYTGEPGE